MVSFGLKHCRVSRQHLLTDHDNRHTTAHSVASFYPPYIPIELSGAECPLLAAVPRMKASSSGYNLADHCARGQLDQDLCDIVDSVDVYASTLDMWMATGEGNFDAVELQNIACLLEYRALVWLDGAPTSKQPPFGQALCIAVLMFVVRSSENPDRSFEPLHYTAVRRLRETLEMSTVDDRLPHWELFAWIFAVGAICAQGSAHSSWFAKQAGDMYSECGLFTFEQLHSFLQSTLWTTTRLDDALQDFWNSLCKYRCERPDSQTLNHR